MGKSVIMYLCMIITLLGCGKTPSPETAYKQLIEHVNKNDWGQFYDGLDAYEKGRLDLATFMLMGYVFDDETSRQIDARDSFIKIAKIYRETIIDFDISQSYKIIQIEKKNSTATLILRVGGAEALQKVFMVLENGEWKLHYVLDKFSPADKMALMVLEKVREEMKSKIVAEATEKVMKGLEEKAESVKQEKLDQEVKRREKEERLKQIINATLLEKSFFGDYISIKIGLENKGGRNIKTVKGSLVFENSLGKICRRFFEYDKGIKANSVEHWAGRINVNYCRTYKELAKCIKERDIPYHRIRQDLNLKNLRLKWNPLIIVFEDGAKLSIKDVE